MNPWPQALYLDDVDVPVAARVRLPPAVRGHRLADDVVQVQTVRFQTSLLLFVEALQIVDRRAGATETATRARAG